MEKSINNEVKADNGSEEKVKPTYEQLYAECERLFGENEYLKGQLQRVNYSNMYRRMDYLFQVLQFENVFKDPDFVGCCAEELKNILTLEPEQEGKPKEES